MNERVKKEISNIKEQLNKYNKSAEILKYSLKKLFYNSQNPNKYVSIKNEKFIL